MNNEKIIKDFRNFHRSTFGQNSMSSVDMMIHGQGGFRNSLTPYVLEERSGVNMTQLDIFSRLLMDRILVFGVPVTSESCNIAISQLLFLEQNDPSRPILVYVNSPGGECYSGLALIDVMNYVSCPVETTCIGLAASMGAMILLSGEPNCRAALQHSRILLHQPLISGNGGGISGQASDIEIEAREILKLKDELYQIICARTGKTMDEVRRDADRDFWLTAEEGVRYGVIDKVISKSTKK